MIDYVLPPAQDSEPGILWEMAEGQHDDLLVDLIKKALRNVFDPEIPHSIYDLGLIYRINIGEKIEIDMTLTSPTCPDADKIPGQVEQAISSLRPCRVNLVWQPYGTWKDCH